MGLRRPLSRLAAALRPGARDRDLDEELRAHLEMEADAQMRRGLPPDEARALARRRFGAVEPMKETYRDTRGIPLLDRGRQDVRYALRMLRRTPAVTAVAILSLALAIGATTAVFTVVNALLLRPLPVSDPAALVSVEARHNGEWSLLSFPMYRDLRERQPVLTDILATAGETPYRLTIPGTLGSPVELDNVRVSFVTGNYFDVLGVRPAIGRLFTPEEDRNPDTKDTLGTVLVLSHSFWTRQFGRDPGVIGRTIVVGRSPCRVIGVTPPGFSGEAVGYAPAGWMPLVPSSSPDDLDNRLGTFTSFMGRLKPGVSREQAEAAMSALFRQLLVPDGRVREQFEDYRVALAPAGTGLDYGLRRTFTRPLTILMAIVVTVLLIACTNVANLLLARAAARRAEIGVRLALGCSRARLIAQLLTESLVLSLLGASAGLALAYWGGRTLLRLIAFGPIPIALDIAPDTRVLGFLAGVSVFTALAFGLAPARRATRVDVAPALKIAGRADAARPPRARLSRALVACQVALSLLLLVGAGLLIRSLQNLHGFEWGFRPERVVIFDLAHNPQNREPEAMARVAWDTYMRVRQVPGADSVSLSGLLLFSPSDIGSLLTIPGYAPPPGGGRATARFNSVSAGYFETIGMTLVRGRGIEERDTITSPLVAVVNESMERAYFRSGAVGRTLQLGAGINRGKPVEIVGVVRDARYNNLREDAKPMFYVPIVQLPRSLRSLEVRTSQPIAVIAPAVRQALASVTKDLMIRRVVPLADQVDQSLAGERLIMTLASLFGALALLLACVGLYGVLSYTVAQRTGEIGIRMALGATGGSVRWLVLRQTLAMVAAGVALGVPLALAAARLVSGFLYGLTPRDPTTMATAIAMLVGSAAIAAYLPARRAARVDPMTALRCE